MEEPVVDISGLDKAAVLAALFNRAGAPRPGSAAMLHYTPMPMSVAQARAIIEEDLARPYSSGHIHYDYLEGRCLKIDITGDTFNAWLYDREYGPGAAQRAIDELRGGYTSNPYRRNARKDKRAKRKKKQAKRAARQKKADERRAARPPAGPPSRPPGGGGGGHNWGPEVNAYISFIIYAVSGKMKEADGLMRQYRQAIYRVARQMHQLRPVEISPIYRGLMVEPEKMQAGNRIGRASHVEFVSFSEDRDVACWFADRDSFMNRMDITGQIKGDGWMLELTPERDDILFHWRWGLHFPWMNGREISFGELATRHPDIQIRMMGLDFNNTLRTQQEVMLKPTDEALPAIAHAQAGCPSTQELDRRFHSGPDDPFGGTGIVFVPFRRNPDLCLDCGCDGKCRSSL